MNDSKITKIFDNASSVECIINDPDFGEVIVPPESEVVKVN
jgi:hypothetical protein